MQHGTEEENSRSITGHVEQTVKPGTTLEIYQRVGICNNIVRFRARETVTIEKNNTQGFHFGFLNRRKMDLPRQ